MLALTLGEVSRSNHRPALRTHGGGRRLELSQITLQEAVGALLGAVFVARAADSEAANLGVTGPCT